MKRKEDAQGRFCSSQRFSFSYHRMQGNICVDIDKQRTRLLSSTTFMVWSDPINNIEDPY